MSHSDFYTDTLVESRRAVSALVETLREERHVAAGYDRMGSAMYALGYLESTFANVIADMPKAARARILKDLADTVEVYNSRIKSAKEPA